MLRMLDVIIGLVFVFALLSMVCSALAEGLEALLRKRSSDLRAGIERMLSGSGPEYVKAVYDHPLIKALYDVNGAKPSYIPSRTFSLALLDVLAKSDQARKDAVTTLDRLPDNKIGNAIRALAVTTGGQIEGVVAAVSGWFDNAMDRVSSTYKRRTHWILLAFGLVVAGALNADAVNMATILAADPALRSAVVDAAVKRVAAGQDAEPRPAPPVGGSLGQEAGPPAPAGSSEKGGQGPGVRRTAEEAAAAIDELRGLSLPLGWTRASIQADPRGLPRNAVGWLAKIAGLLTTAFALSMGAPFWFDILDKVVKVRTATKPVESGSQAGGGQGGD